MLSAKYFIPSCLHFVQYFDPLGAILFFSPADCNDMKQAQYDEKAQYENWMKFTSDVQLNEVSFFPIIVCYI